MPVKNKMLTGWNSNNGMGNLLTQVGLRGFFHLCKNHGTNLLRSLKPQYYWYFNQGGSKHCNTHEFFELMLVLDLNHRLSTLGGNLERPVLRITFNFSVIEVAPNETLRIEDSVLWVGVERILGRVTN